MPITVKDIAKIAGVSRATVDRALKGRAGINEVTRDKILEIALDNNYVPNIIGKALVKSKELYTIAVIINSVGNNFFTDVKNGIFDAEREFKDYGFKIKLIEFKGYDYNVLNKLIDQNIDQEVKAVILTPINHKVIENKINYLVDKGIEVVTLTSDIPTSKRLAYVGCDYYKSGKIAGQLIAITTDKRAKICIVTGSKEHIGHNLRLEGIKDIIKCYKDMQVISVIENQDDNIIAYNLMQETLEYNPYIDFVYITAGGVEGTLQAIEQSGKIIKVCSFDDIEATKENIKSGKILATVTQQPYLQGYNSIKLLFDLIIANKKVESINYMDLVIKVSESL